MKLQTYFVRPLALITPALLVLLGGCGDPCLDDGPAKGDCKNPVGSDDNPTTDTTADGTADADATADATETATGDATTDTTSTTTDTTDATDTTTDTTDATTDTGGDPCANGMMDPGETDVDCGGVCVFVNPNNPNDIEGQCTDGEMCQSVEDCVAGECDDQDICNVCPGMPPEFDPMDLGYNSCQSCLLSNCCDAVIDCFTNIEQCVCWFNCVTDTGATQQCMDECGNGNIGQINSCMNNSCKADMNSMNCAAP